MSGEREVILLLGGNVGDVAGTFARVEELLVVHVGRILSRSRDHWTEPWGFTDDRLFLNRALLVYTALAPEALLRACLSIERELGRTREDGKRYGPRTIDIDILFIGAEVVDLPDLRIPHPRVHERSFALEPAADIAPLLVHPVIGRTVLELCNDLRQPSAS